MRLQIAHCSVSSSHDAGRQAIGRLSMISFGIASAAGPDALHALARRVTDMGCEVAAAVALARAPIMETVQAAFQAYFASDPFENCPIDMVKRGGVRHGVPPRPLLSATRSPHPPRRRGAGVGIDRPIR
jgi:hypothetical protein